MYSSRNDQIFGYAVCFANILWLPNSTGATACTAPAAAVAVTAGPPRAVQQAHGAGRCGCSHRGATTGARKQWKVPPTLEPMKCSDSLPVNKGRCPQHLC